MAGLRAVFLCQFVNKPVELLEQYILQLSWMTADYKLQRQRVSEKNQPQNQ